jgi:acetyl esterase
VGSPETHDSLARQIAKAARALVVSVDYRLAPEHKFPAAIDDAYASLIWAKEHAHEIGGDASRIAVCGDSAGGNLAATVSLRAREELGPKLRAQVLIYPATKPDFETRSYLEHATGYGLTRARMQWYWDQYLDEDRRRHPLAAPAFATSLKDLPPATVLTAEHDVLRDEGDMYAEALYRAKNDVAHRRVSGVIHGYIMMHRLLRSARESVDFIGHRLRAAFE